MHESVLSNCVRCIKEDVVGDFDLVPHTARKKQIDVALSNSFGFGGTNASLVLKKI